MAQVIMWARSEAGIPQTVTPGIAPVIVQNNTVDQPGVR